LGLFDVFGIIEADVVPIFGLEGGIGVVIDFGNILESGVFATGGGALGANLGFAAGGGFAIRELEGVSYNLDINAWKVSPTVSFDDDGFNAAALAVGPGIGASFSITKTKTYTVNDMIKDFKDFISKFGSSNPCK
jgi:hypothetical protein